MHAGWAIRSVRTFISNENGNFAIFAAATLPLFIAVASFAVDTTNAFSMKSRLQNAADAAALATSSRLAKGELLPADAEAYASTFFEGMVAEDGAAYSGFAATPVIDVTPVTDAKGRKTWEVSITATGSQDLTPMANLLGKDTLTVGVHGRSESAEAMQAAFSMVLVVDKSGSMDWYGKNQWTPSNGNPKKIVSLKNAVATLATTIDEADPGKIYSRLGAVSYDSELHRTQDLNWGTAETKTFIDSLPAVGGTSSTGAFKWAYDELSADAEDDAHEAVNKLDPLKYIIFMTDGENNNYWDDYLTDYYCDQAKEDGIVIYSVAFMAPTSGQELLAGCATSSAHYFDAANNAELVRAFKNIGQAAAKMVSRLVE